MSKVEATEQPEEQDLEAAGGNDSAQEVRALPRCEQEV